MKLFASDIDNTLVPKEESFVKEDLKELEDILKKRKDLKIAYISGRSLSMILEVLADYYLPQTDFLSSDVGTAIYSLRRGEWKKDKDYEDYLLSESYNWLEMKKKLKGIAGLSLQEDRAQTDFKLSYYLKLDYNKKEALEEIEERLVDTPAKLIYSEDRVKNLGLVDIIPRLGGKGGVLEFLAKKLGAGKDEVIYAGDSGNDLEALSTGFKAVLVGNAPESLKKDLSGDPSRVYIAKKNFSQGIIEGLKHFSF